MARKEEIAGLIADLIVEATDVDRSAVTPRSRFADFGLDSVEAMALVAQVEERYGVSVDEDELARIATLRELVRAVERLLKAR